MKNYIELHLLFELELDNRKTLQKCSPVRWVHISAGLGQSHGFLPITGHTEIQMFSSRWLVLHFKEIKFSPTQIVGSPQMISNRLRGFKKNVANMALVGEVCSAAQASGLLTFEANVPCEPRPFQQEEQCK